MIKKLLPEEDFFRDWFKGLIIVIIAVLILTGAYFGIIYVYHSY